MATAFGYAGRFAEAEREIAEACATPAAAGLPLISVYARVARAFSIELWTGSAKAACDALAEAQAELERRGAAHPFDLGPSARRCWSTRGSKPAGSRRRSSSSGGGRRYTGRPSVAHRTGSVGPGGDDRPRALQPSLDAEPPTSYTIVTG